MGRCSYPAFPGDPFYEGFITEEGAILPPDLFPGGGPTALAEFFGDHMVFNSKIWPKEDVEPRNYRMRLLNGCDSRFMVLQSVAADAGATDLSNAGAAMPFWVIGSDQGLGTAEQTDTLVFEPDGRYDVIFDFSDPALAGKRVIMKHIGGDERFGGAIPGPQVFGETDMVMAFDVVKPLNTNVPDAFDPTALPGYDGVPNGATTRRVALFEGVDEFGRLQPLLGTVADDLGGTNVATAYAWFQPTTETPSVGTTEIWEIYNFTADAHPIHLHLVNFQILDREDFAYDITGTQTVTQHNGTTGQAPEISNIRNLTPVSVGTEYFEQAPKDMVTSLPGDPEGEPPTGQLVRIKPTRRRPRSLGNVPDQQNRVARSDTDRACVTLLDAGVRLADSGVASTGGSGDEAFEQVAERGDLLGREVGAEKFLRAVLRGGPCLGDALAAGGGQHSQGDAGVARVGPA